jgi:transcriptional regulator with PAS, ATPase and Fis domain
MRAVTTEPREADERHTNQRVAAHLSLALRADAPTAPLSRHALEGVDEVEIGRAESPSCARGSTLTIGLPDRWMSARHARLVRKWDKWRVTDLGSRNGTFVNGERVDERVLEDGDVVEIGSASFVFRASEPVLAAPDAEAKGPLSSLRPRLVVAFAQLAELARSEVPLVLFGEPGTGKEIVAREVHALSGRKGDFVAINCAALPPTLLESELFGYRKGAFSGATEDRLGLLRAADGGTLLLDEIGDLAAPAQAALLRVLQENEVLPIGATRPVAVDLRVVSATHRDLARAIEDGTFRDDLAGRLDGFTIELPPLRERREDIGLFVAALLERHAPEPSRVRFGVRAARALFENEWPGNVRQLEQALRTALVVSRDAPEIDAAHLSRSGLRGSSAPPPPGDDRRRTLEDLLERHGGNVSAVSRELGKARAQVHRWIREYGLETWRLRDQARKRP